MEDIKTKHIIIAAIVGYVLSVSYLLCVSIKLTYRIDDAQRYIRVLEEQVDTDTMFDVVVTTDAYQEYYHQ